jgi:uncharacterized RmlC-like cupin family protein
VPITDRFFAQDDKDGALPTCARPLTVELRAATAAHLHNELESGILVPYS